MAATAQYIIFDNHAAVSNNSGFGGWSSQLTVNFRVVGKGPAHVAGLIYTTDFWVTNSIIYAKFQHFSGNEEVWQAIIKVPGQSKTFEYTIFCDDHRDVQFVKKIYHTNNGNGFHILAT